VTSTTLTFFVGTITHFYVAYVHAGESNCKVVPPSTSAHQCVPSAQPPRAHASFRRGGGCQGRRARACPAAAAARARRSARRAHSRPPGRTGGRRSAPRRQSCAASLATSWAARAGPPRRQKRRLRTRKRAAVTARIGMQHGGLGAAQHAQRCQHVCQLPAQVPRRRHRLAPLSTLRVRGASRQPGVHSNATLGP